MSIKKEKTRLHILRHVGKILDERIAEQLNDIGVHKGQGMVLSILKRHETVTQADMARGMSRKPPTLTSMLKPMEEKGWIRRYTDPKTNRAVVVSLTSKGKEMAESVENIWVRVEQTLSKAIPNTDLKLFLLQMEAILSELGGSLPEFTTYKTAGEKS